MGYTTDFWGEFSVTPTLTPEHKAYLAAFADTRRMKRDAEKAALLPDPIREAVGLPIGEDGGFYVGEAGRDHGQLKDDSILDYNEAPGMPAMTWPSSTAKKAEGDDPMANFNERFDEFWKAQEVAREFWKAQEVARQNGAQPGLWCQWVPNEDGTAIVWDQGEKFYNYVEWIEYLIANFLRPWGYTVSGEVTWAGEENDDRGKILIVSNEVRVMQGKIVYG